jgi:hypothetical protein
MKTKKEINDIANLKYAHQTGGLFSYTGFVEGYTEAQNDMKKYKKGFDLLYDFIDDLSEEWATENPKLVKQLDKIGL